MINKCFALMALVACMGFSHLNACDVHTWGVDSSDADQQVSEAEWLKAIDNQYMEPTEGLVIYNQMSITLYAISLVQVAHPEAEYLRPVILIRKSEAQTTKDACEKDCHKKFNTKIALDKCLELCEEQYKKDKKKKKGCVSTMFVDSSDPVAFAEAKYKSDCYSYYLYWANKTLTGEERLEAFDWILKSWLR